MKYWVVANILRILYTFKVYLKRPNTESYIYGMNLNINRASSILWRTYSLQRDNFKWKKVNLLTEVSRWSSAVYRSNGDLIEKNGSIQAKLSIKNCTIWFTFKIHKKKCFETEWYGLFVVEFILSSLNFPKLIIDLRVNETNRTQKTCVNIKKR